MALFAVTTIDRDDPGRLPRFNGGDVQIRRWRPGCQCFIPLDVAYRHSTQGHQLAPRLK
jgi:hypothetical protein